MIWLDQMAEPERSQAMANLHSDLDKMTMSSRKVETIGEAISIGLKQWQATPEGFDYWREIHNKYCSPESKMSRITDPDGDKINGGIDGYLPRVYKFQ